MSMTVNATPLKVCVVTDVSLLRKLKVGVSPSATKQTDLEFSIVYTPSRWGLTVVVSISLADRANRQ